MADVRISDLTPGGDAVAGDDIVEASRNDGGGGYTSVFYTMLQLATYLAVENGSGTAALLDSIDEDDMASDAEDRLPTQQSVKAFVLNAIATEIANLINSAPGALNDLNELAAALGDDANFAATMTTALAGKQPLNSGLTSIAALSTTATGRSLLAAANAAAIATIAGVGAGNSPQFASVELGHATDTTLARIAAGRVSLEGSELATLPGTQTLANKTLTSPAIGGTIAEDTHTIADGAGFEISPDNGSVQQITLGASRTPTKADWSNGHAIILKIADGSGYAVTWTTVDVTWLGGAAPTLATTGWTWVALWQEDGDIYGKHIGDSE